MRPSNTFFAKELRTQPADWLRAAGWASQHREALPQPGERVAVVGCGTSYYVSLAYACLRESRGQGLTDAYTASEHRLTRGYDRLLVVSRSGTTTEIIDLLEAVRGQLSMTAIVATPGTAVLGLADHAIPLPEVDERSVVQTRFATTTLAILRAHLGESVETASHEARSLLDGSEAEVLGSLVHVDQITFLGADWTNGLALEAALKLRESAQFWTEQYPVMEYRHGPISIAQPGRAVWAFGQVPHGLADQIRATGAHFEHSQRDPMAELVRVHLLCEVMARRRGVDPDRPRHLSRSIVLGAARPAS